MDQSTRPNLDANPREAPRPARAGSGLAAHKLQRAFSAIDANLGTTLHVRQLADAVNRLPRLHYS